MGICIKIEETYRSFLDSEQSRSIPNCSRACIVHNSARAQGNEEAIVGALSSTPVLQRLRHGTQPLRSEAVDFRVPVALDLRKMTKLEELTRVSEFPCVSVTNKPG